MLPTYHQLKLQLWWILSDPGESHDKYLKEYQAFFSEQAPLLDVDATFSFGEVCRKQSRNLYEESIYQVDCTIEWPGITWFGPSTKHLQVGREWCNAGRDQGSNKALFQWLVPSLLEAFQLATHPVDWNVSLLSFSFGTLAELGTYVQHHQCHRDYWVDSTFQHDQRSLHIDLHLNHRSGCEDRVAEYRFVMPYLNILKVLINETKRFIELYLHLKIPAMLMGKVVSNIPARPGSAAAAAPLRLERYRAIGCNCIGGAVRMASLCGGLFLKLAVRDHSLARHVVGRLFERCAHGTLICYAPIRTHSSEDAAFKWSHEVQVYDVMKLADRPLAVQIRYAGSKVMLCINPALPNKKLLCLRPSIQTFSCTSSEYLDVVKVSASRSVTLNPPLITILQQLGVRTDTFIRLQENIQFTDALVEESSAVNMLAAWSKLPLPYEDLSKAGFQLTLDPFFRSLLLAVYRNAVAGLRYKTRIVLPVDRACNMLGVVDTTNKLRYGECTEIRRPHVQYHEPPKRTVIMGTVLVTKCPGLHPGDVRKFTAINMPELHHVIDCIVFPAHGPRPHPDEMAGSDLDWDEYIVIWEKCLFFVGPNRPPMIFSDRNPEPDNKEITANLIHE